MVMTLKNKLFTMSTKETQAGYKIFCSRQMAERLPYMLLLAAVFRSVLFDFYPA